MTDISDSIQINDKSRKSWTEDEDIVLTKLVKKYGVKRWTDISKAMVDLFQIVGKSGKQCRQRWVNHLDPKINKDKWTIAEERRIFDAHKVHGNKWKIIAKQLDSRTDNSIKNHFYSILRKGLRRVNKMMGDRKSTEKVKDIRTSVLSKLDKLDESLVQQNKKINVQSIYELLFQFSSMSTGNVSQNNLTSDLITDFKEMIGYLMSLSSQQKIKKQKNIALNKDKRNRKNSLNQISSSSGQMQEEEIESDSNQKQNHLVNQEIRCFNNSLTTAQNPNKFMVNLEIPERSRESQCQKYFIDERTSEKANSFINLIQQTPHKTIISRINSDRFQINQFGYSQKGDYFNVFPNITINLDQPMSFTHSNDFNLNCFNKSPLFSSARMVDHFNIHTPRVPSPGAFNFCAISTAQSLGNYASLANKEGQTDQKSMGFDNQLEKIVEQLRSNIDANCNVSPLSGSRVNSSRGSFIEPCLKASSSSIFLTPGSGSGKAH